MLTREISYIDYGNNERKEKFFFNLSQAEVAELEFATVGGLQAKIQTMVEKHDGPGIMKFFKEIILKAYGVRSADMKRFEKSEELSIAFSQTEAYSQLFMELVMDPAKAAAFIEGIVPQMAVLPEEAKLN